MPKRKVTVCRRNKPVTGTIKEKDLKHLATARALGIDIIAYDRDFEGIKEYFTPKEFLVSINLRTYDTVY